MARKYQEATPEIRRAIRAMRTKKPEMTLRQIAENFNVSLATVEATLKPTEGAG